MAYLKKTSLTRKKIRNVFIKILTEKNFESITINDIVDKAEINRSSFYRYYNDKYELIEEIEDEIIKDIKHHRKEIEINELIDKFNTDELKKILLFLKGYAPAINALLSINSTSTFENKMKREISRKFYTNSQISNKENHKYLLLKEYLTDIVIQTIKYWCSENCEMSEGELSELISDIYLHGFFKAINNIENSREH